LRDVKKTQDTLRSMLPEFEAAIENDSIEGAMLILRLRDRTINCLTYFGSLEYTEWAGLMECLKSQMVQAWWEEMDLDFVDE
jgi:hypothetical protein